MKTYTFGTLRCGRSLSSWIASAFLATILVTLNSCSTPEPPNNAHDKGHEDAAKVVVRFTPGSLAKEDIGNKVYGDGFTAESGAKPIQVTYAKHDDNGFALDGEVTLRKGVWYRMEVLQYNLAGEDINHEFIANAEQRDMHQFNYRTFPNSEVGATQTFGLIDYRYGDKDDSGTLLKTPVGLTGYIKLLDAAPESFSLRIELLHITPPVTKIDPQTGKPRPFDKPLKSLNVVKDIDFFIPFHSTK